MNRLSLLFVISLTACAAAQAGPTVLASVGPGGEQTSEDALAGWAMSADGTRVAFATTEAFVAADQNDDWDVYLRDLGAGTTTLVSVGADGMAAGSSRYPAISGDGGSVAFSSGAANLVDGDTNGIPDVFVRNMATGQTVRVNVSSAGVQADEYELGQPDWPAAMSFDGRFVTFKSEANTLVAAPDMGWPQVYLHDLETSQTERISVSSSEFTGAGESKLSAISDDGRFVAFQSNADNLHPDADSTHIFVRDRLLGTTALVSRNGSGAVWGQDPSISGDGRFISYVTSEIVMSSDHNSRDDVYIWDNAVPHYNIRATVTSDETEAQEGCRSGRLSRDGRFVVFVSRATEFDPHTAEDIDHVFVRDLSAGTTTLASIGGQGALPLAHCRKPSISADGRHVAFESTSEGLVSGDDNSALDVFVHDRQPALPGCPGDVNGNQAVEFGDLNTLLTAFNTASADPGYNAFADIDGDGDVDFADLNVVVSAFNTDC